jgi:hypothetical protein
MKEFNRKMEESLNKFKEKTKKRQEYNYKCLDILKEMVENYPDWRFMQILSNTGIDEINFYEESVDTFNKIKKL